MAWAKINDEHLTSYADSIRYAKDGTEYRTTLEQAREEMHYTPTQMETELQNIAEGYVSAVDELAQDNTYFSEISTAIVDKDGGSPPAKNEMASRIEALEIVEPPVQNPALVLMDWEGTILKEYTKEQALALTELPNPDTLLNYQGVDHEWLLFQNWNYTLNEIKTQIQNNNKIIATAFYTTTDGQNHNYWGSPRGTGDSNIVVQKRGISNIVTSEFSQCYTLTHISIPYGVTRIGSSGFYGCRSLKELNIPNSVTDVGTTVFAGCYSITQINLPESLTRMGDNDMFRECYSLTQINIPSRMRNISNAAFYQCYSLAKIAIPNSVTTIGTSAFRNCKTLYDILLEGTPTISSTNVLMDTPSNQLIYVPRANLSWFETATNWSTYYDRFVAIEDNIEYLESLGFNVDEYKGGVS